MSQTTEPEPENWRGRWDGPNTGGSDEPQGRARGSRGSTPDVAEPTQQIPASTVSCFEEGPPDPGPASERRDRKGPTWMILGAATVATALLASLLTVGVSDLFEDDGNSGSIFSTSSSDNGKQVDPPVKSTNGSAPDWQAVASTVGPSVVSVKLTARQESPFGQQETSSGEGSGVIIDTAGHVLTNNHVVDGAGQNGSITVLLSDGRGYSADVVGTDPATDLAVIKIKDTPKDLKAATLGNSSDVKVGSGVMALGNPLGLSNTVTTGIVSAVNRPVTTTVSSSQQQNPFGQSTGEQVVTNAIQTDAAVNPGNSGGALVDSGGRVVGITSSIASLGSSVSGQSGSIGLGFAIPINKAKSVANELIKSGTATHAWMGVTLRDGRVEDSSATRESAQVESVSKDSPADKAGMKRGDQIIAIDKVAVSGSDSLVAHIRERDTGTEVTFTVIRGKEHKDIKVKLGTRPNQSQ
ncbi:MAG: putative serine protease PepD [Actinomycetota bacterium]|nr:putative serine protease PepD [Actinomycetota bacterium]